MRETDLYDPVKAYLEAQGFQVRGEVGACDMLALREETVIAVELKLSFGLPVLYQAIARQAIADLVYVAVAESEGKAARRAWERQRGDAVRLCRLLGLGLLTVRGTAVSAHADPGPYKPRRNPRLRTRLLREFRGRTGDHNRGGSRGVAVVTAYREDALRCAAYLAREGPRRVAEIRAATGVERAGTILLRDVYGWFEKAARGTYGVSPGGLAALDQFAAVLDGFAATQ
ncbi:DUF2161 family putative PD-(D/E)XK-type phosphodiesterase [Arenibaculum pallidiluteum]|uniref:DUF2161 family putative PD-(D/E)XK-type phosphodiesterase n=1 Tax=Arenibaculum pallidiluteum TaxID=2812559 RepID=UPI001A95CABD|nr:DUF2161 family putative PD-(D/E)XK-type phosphodiesterase [Arenibaculum pallidiluteum]